jgi:hypothetical protein
MPPDALVLLTAGTWRRGDPYGLGIAEAFLAHEAGSVALQLLHAPTLDGEPLGPATDAQVALALWLVRQAGDLPTGARLSMDDLTVEKWLMSQTGIPSDAQGSEQRIAAAAERFAALTPAKQRAWLEENYSALRAGELTLEDLP